MTVVVFDLDDTLYLERDFVRSGFRAVDRWLARERATTGLFEIAWRLFEAGERARIFDQALVHLDVAAEPVLIERLVAVYRDHEPEIALLPEAADLLAWLRGRWPLALLTGGCQTMQRRKVRALGLEDYCRPIVYTDALGRACREPSARGFRAIQRRFGLAPERFLYVGCDPARDFRAARTLGWQTIRVRHPGSRHAGARAAAAEDDADHTIARLTDLIRDRLLEHPTGGR